MVKSLAYSVLASTNNQARHKVDLLDNYDRNKNLFVDQYNNTDNRYHGN